MPYLSDRQIDELAKIAVLEYLPPLKDYETNSKHKELLEELSGTWLQTTEVIYSFPVEGEKEPVKIMGDSLANLVAHLVLKPGEKVPGTTEEYICQTALGIALDYNKLKEVLSDITDDPFNQYKNKIEEVYGKNLREELPNNLLLGNLDGGKDSQDTGYLLSKNEVRAATLVGLGLVVLSSIFSAYGAEKLAIASGVVGFMLIAVVVIVWLAIKINPQIKEVYLEAMQDAEEPVVTLTVSGEEKISNTVSPMETKMGTEVNIIHHNFSPSRIGENKANGLIAKTIAAIEKINNASGVNSAYMSRLDILAGLCLSNGVFGVWYFIKYWNAYGMDPTKTCEQLLLGKQVYGYPYPRQVDIWLAWKDNAPLGYAVALGPDKYRHIAYVAVVPEMRRQGVGINLMKEFFEYARRQGIEEVSLHASADNLGALELYRKAGRFADKVVEMVKQTPSGIAQIRMEFSINRGKKDSRQAGGSMIVDFIKKVPAKVWLLILAAVSLLLFNVPTVTGALATPALAAQWGAGVSVAPMVKILGLLVIMVSGSACASLYRSQTIWRLWSLILEVRSVLSFYSSLLIIFISFIVIFVKQISAALISYRKLGIAALSIFTLATPLALAAQGVMARVAPQRTSSIRNADKEITLKRVKDGGIRAGPDNFDGGITLTRRDFIRLSATIAGAIGFGASSNRFSLIKLAAASSLSPQSSPLIAFLKENRTSYGLPLSFYILPSEKQTVYSQMGDTNTVAGVIERMIVEEGLVTYDGALWQIILALTGDIELAQKPIEIYWEGRLGALNTIRAGYAGNNEQPFIYDKANPWQISASLADKGKRGYVFKLLNAQGKYLTADPLDGKATLAGYPEYDRI
ncbi:MAG: GNAT family N-acetyltransferase, partial [Candidatus Omnitrophica bacterium]|nr:GNAT family N-acetyltransferase [Candidatus Omnitrophota bacterium]